MVVVAREHALLPDLQRSGRRFRIWSRSGRRRVDAWEVEQRHENGRGRVEYTASFAACRKDIRICTGSASTTDADCGLASAIGQHRHESGGLLRGSRGSLGRQNGSCVWNFASDHASVGSQGYRCDDGNAVCEDDANTRVRGQLSRIAAGHASHGDGSILGVNYDSTGKALSVLKAFDKDEHNIYSTINSKRKYKADPVREFMSRFQGVIHDARQEGMGQKYIQLSNLLHPFVLPKVMDVKMGTRTYLESECANKKPRCDLYERMCEMYPSAVAAEDHAAGAITKHKWMSLRDANSTTGTLGYRIDGMVGGQTPSQGIALGEIRTQRETRSIFKYFAEAAACNDDVSHKASPVFIAERIVGRLKDLRLALEASSFFANHECVGTSLLLVADSKNLPQVFWIDFAKTREAPVGVPLTHRRRWEVGSHEDGFLFGLDRLIEDWCDVVKELQEGQVR